MSWIQPSIILICSVIAFFALHKPDSEQVKEVSEETINQNRAKLILDLYNNHQDPSDILLGLAIIRHSYPKSDSNWLNRIEQLTISRIQFKKLEEIKNIPQDHPYYSEIIRLVDEIERLHKLKLEVELLLVAEIRAEKVENSKGISSVSYHGLPNNSFNKKDQEKNEEILKELNKKIKIYVDELEKYEVHLDM